MTDWRVYDEPELLAMISAAAGTRQREILLAVDGIHCSACVAGLERALAGEAERVQVNLATRTAELSFDPQRAPLSRLLGKLEQAGYRPQVLAQGQDTAEERRQRRLAMGRIGIAVLCSMQVMMLAWPEYSEYSAHEPMDAGIARLLRWTQWVFATPVVFYSGWPFLSAAWQALHQRTLGMDVPVALSILLAYAVSALRVVHGEGALYFDAATMFVTLLSIGRYLEGRTRALAAERLRLLAGRQTLTAMRMENGLARSVAISALAVGDVVQVAPGEALPADGELLDAVAELDESLLSGESRPVPHGAGSTVLAGSLNAGAKPFLMRVQAVGSATRLASIQRLLLRAQHEKPPAQKLADRIAGVFVLAVLLLAAAGGLWWWPQDREVALNVVLAVLVVSCPCALALAIPAVYAAASSRLAAAGVLLAQPAVLSKLPQLTHVLFDKTGTLTIPALQLETSLVLGTKPAEACLAIAAALEQGLRHPIAAAFRMAAPNAPAAADVALVRGGVQGRIQDVPYWLGAPEALPIGKDQAVAVLRDYPALTAVALADGNQLLALFLLGNPLRAEAIETVHQLQQDGIKLVLLSGDGAASVQAVARTLNLTKAQARQTPEQKLQCLRGLQQHGAVVMAVGDGINDAPLLAAADIGVAMPAGAALAQAKADVILIGDSLSGLQALRHIGRQAAQRVRENIAWALGYNIVMLPLAFSSELTPWMAALGMSISSLLVVANALRLHAPSRSFPSDTVS